jgi:heat shock protein HslJ
LRHALFCAAALAAFATVGCGETSDTINGSSAPPLAGTTWRLLSIEGHEAIAGVRVTLSFGEEQSVAGSAGCNSYFGSALAEGSELKIGVLTTTRKQCDDDVMPQEQAYLSALAKARVYSIVGMELHVGPDANVTTLVFRFE